MNYFKHFIYVFEFMIYQVILTLIIVFTGVFAAIFRNLGWWEIVANVYIRMGKEFEKYINEDNKNKEM